MLSVMSNVGFRYPQPLMIGIVLYMMILGQLPYPTGALRTKATEMKRIDRLSCNLEPAILTLIESMIAGDHALRPTIAEGHIQLKQLCGI